MQMTRNAETVARVHTGNLKTIRIKYKKATKIDLYFYRFILVVFLAFYQS